ncbi:GPP34 family phosphoprotein [Streptomyces sp. NPDC017988]|uniref:GOLPH3/VPS74 family protein n=1 Tax=Streptomyces sp. NPDC017988 TaxID=3365025 RepID=UPI00378BA4A8
MHHGTLSLPARIFLLAWDTDRGKFTGGPDLHLAVRTGALAELAQRRVLGEAGGVVVTPATGARTGDVVLDALLDLVERSKPRKWRGWMTYRSRTTLDAVRDQLAAEGHLREERRRVLGLFPSRRWVLERTGHAEALRTDALAVLRAQRPVTEVSPGDAALVVCAATGKVRTFVGTKDRRRYKDRLAELTDRAGGDDPELRTLMRNLRKAHASAVTSAEMARSSSGGDGGGD